LSLPFVLVDGIRHRRTKSKPLQATNRRLISPPLKGEGFTAISGKPIRITRFGKPLAEVVPPSTPERPSTWLGYMAGRGKITGDIISPAAKESEWEVLRD
jgi:hypothetical protein